MIPKLSAPLIKDIRTGEGILEWVAGAVITVAGATSSMSWWHTTIGLTILAVSKSLRRGSLKIAAANKTLGIGDPIPFDLGSVVGDVAGIEDVGSSIT
jgi:hypothetical protein